MKEKNRIDNPGLEKKLGIGFVKVNQEAFDKLVNHIDVLAKSLNVSAPTLNLPENGFLSDDLTSEQELEINKCLGPEYARMSVELQDKLSGVEMTEGNEIMVSLPKLFNDSKVPLSLSTVPFHEACGEWAGKERLFWVRKSVADKLLQAGTALNLIGLQFHLEDAFRPLGVQEGLFLRRVKNTLLQHPDWNNRWDLIWTEARSKTAVNPWMAGHKSGAAIDTTLRTLDGIPLLVGNSYPEGGPKVAIHYPYITQEQWSNRQIFKNVTEMVGLIIYPYENWHVSSGDLSSAIKINSITEVIPSFKTIYGPIKGFDKNTGEIDAYKREEYFQPFYNIDDLKIRFQDPNYK